MMSTDCDITLNNKDGSNSGGILRRSPTAYSRYSYEASGFPAQRQKGKATTTAADRCGSDSDCMDVLNIALFSLPFWGPSRYYDTTSYNKVNGDNYSNGTSGRESRQVVLGF